MVGSGFLHVDHSEPMGRATAWLLVGSCVLFSVSPVDAGKADAPATTAFLRAGDLPADFDGPPPLDEPLYTTVPPISDFIQQEPREGEPATEKTEMWVAFDDDNVYVAFRCWESEPDRVVANEMRRDGPNLWQGNDLVAFSFDTFRDRRNSFNFITNALGAREDGQVTN